MTTEWKKVRLGELYEVHNGLSKGGKFFGSGYPFLSFSTIFNNFFIPENIKDLVQSTPEEQENYSVKAGDVFVTRTSETADELGMSCVALKDYPNATYNGFCKRLRPIDSEYKVLPKYIGYCLRTPEFRGNFLGLSGSMTTRASLKNDDLLSMTIPLPPFETQQKIAGILSAYDDLIENNRKQIKLLEETAQKLYKEWFVKLNFPGHENVKVVDGLPEGWKKGKVDDVVIYHDTKRKPLSSMERSKMKGDYRYYGAASVLDYVNSYLFDGTYLLLGEDGTVITTDGYPVLQYITGKFWVNNHAHVLTGKNYFSTEFIYMMFSCMKIKDIVTGAAQPKISQARLSNKEIILPCEALVRKFSDTTKPIFDKIFNSQLSILNLQSARDKLLPRLMNVDFEL